MNAVAENNAGERAVYAAHGLHPRRGETDLVTSRDNFACFSLQANIFSLDSVGVLNARDAELACIGSEPHVFPVLIHQDLRSAARGEVCDPLQFCVLRRE